MFCPSLYPVSVVQAKKDVVRLSQPFGWQEHATPKGKHLAPDFEIHAPQEAFCEVKPLERFGAYV